MRQKTRRLLAFALTACMLLGTCITASAFTYPSAYWKLHSAWDTAVSAQDPDQIISVAWQTYDLLTQYELCSDICWNLEPKCAKAAWAAEIKGDIPQAIEWLNRQLVFAKWLDQNVNSYRDTLLDVNARLEYLNAAAQVQVYSLTGEGSPYSYGPKSGTWYGSDTGGSQSGESAVLTYITFLDGYSVEYWLDYQRKTSSKFAQAAQPGGVVEVAWNFSSENTAGAQQVLSAEAGSYISEGVRSMSNLGATVLLRLGAEMNNWSDCDPAVYIQAFQRVAQEAKRYPNVMMVFSPDNVSNRNVSFEDFYPGDQYVDWIGVSTYHNTNYASSNGGDAAYRMDYTGYLTDAYYGTGLYDSDPLVILRPLARFAQNHNKPMMISECGFSYRNTATGADQTSFAADQLNKFYSYVNMIYPQVKAVFYFDVALSGTYYTLAGNSTVASTYRNAIAGNGGYLAQGQTSGKNWVALSQNVTLDKKDSIKLGSYAIFPGTAGTTVTYLVDGAQVHQSSSVPFYYELKGANLSAGQHQLQVVATSGQFTARSPVYNITVAANDPKGFALSSASIWAQELLAQAYEKGLTTARTSSGLQNRITRLQFAELAVNLVEKTTGKEIALNGESFPDTTDTAALKAVAAGITSGKEGGRFAPNDLITRQEICVMLNKVIQYVDAAQDSQTLSNTSTELDARFTDGEEIAGWALNAVAALTNNGLMSGKEGGRVAPEDNTAIEEAIVLILALNNKF